MEIINKNIYSNEGHSCNSGNNHLNNNINNTNILMNHKVVKDNTKSNNETINTPKINQLINEDNINDISFERKITKKQNIAINNDVIVSGNEINPEKIYIRIKMLGNGAFGEVWQVRHIDLNRDYAMKIIRKRKNRGNDEEDNDNEIEIRNEIEILKHLDHPKILKIVDFYSTLKRYYIITEFCPEGELFNEIIKVGKFDEGQSAFILNQILKAVKYCHKMNVIHRDIKPENIMITNREKNGCLQVKLIDFGTATISEKGQKENKYVGSSYYMDPEIIKRKYDEKCDLWSIGVILYILLNGRPPFDGNDDDEILENVAKGVYDKWSYPYPLLSSEAKDLINKLLQYDPKQRISAEEALEHPWFKKAEFKKKDKVNSICPKLAKELINNLT